MENKVIDSRLSKDGQVIRRRRECNDCSRRFTTYERIEEVLPQVVKADGQREPFDHGKLVLDIQEACKNRAVPSANIEQLVADTVRLYPVLMRQFLTSRMLFPAGQLAEVRYEELLANPAGALRQVYAELDLPGFEALEAHLAVPERSQLGQLAGHDVSLTSSQEELVRREWGFAFEALGYSIDPKQLTEPAAVTDED